MSALGFDDERADAKSFVALNILSWPRGEVVKMPAMPNTPHYGLASGDTGIMEIRPLAAPYTASTAAIREVKRGVYKLSNSHYHVEVSNGVITSLYDVAAKREVIPKGRRANQLVIFDDKPLYWQAWDVEVYHLESRRELHASKTVIAEHGPHRVSVVTETRISEHSWVKTTISLSAAVHDQPSYIEMEAEVEWRESMKFLKIEFPVDVVNTEASYETQFGIVRRPTHYNTTWDMAKFEVCCHKWADLSEAGYGVSILNDSKYGFATVGNLMRLSLLRAPKAPDSHADMGEPRLLLPALPHIPSTTAPMLPFSSVLTTDRNQQAATISATPSSHTLDPLTTGQSGRPSTSTTRSRCTRTRRRRPSHPFSPPSASQARRASSLTPSSAARTTGTSVAASCQSAGAEVSS